VSEKRLRQFIDGRFAGMPRYVERHVPRQLNCSGCFLYFVSGGKVHQLKGFGMGAEVANAWIGLRSRLQYREKDYDKLRCEAKTI
jgi:hypothetical protein